MINWLLGIGLIVTPFILAPGQNDIAREPKMVWAVMFSLAISLVSLYKGRLKPFGNKWAFLLVGYLIVSLNLSPKPGLLFFGIDSARFWSWEPLFYSLVFLLFTISVASIEWPKDILRKTLDVMVYCGAVMATLVVLQYFRLDQFFEQRFGTYGHMAGTLGNPTLIGPFLVLVIPIALFRRKFALAGLMVAATLATQSNVALLGLIATVLAYLAFKGKRWFVAVTIVVALVVPLLAGGYAVSAKFRDHFPHNERLLTWSQSIADIKAPVMQNSKKIYAITGIGPGSFMYLFHMKNNQRNDNFVYAHNEYVQVLYELGIVGFLLFIGMLGCAARRLIDFKDMFCRRMPPLRRALLASLVGISVCAAGCFVWQVGTHIFYTLTIVGLLYNSSVWVSEGGTNAV